MAQHIVIRAPASRITATAKVMLTPVGMVAADAGTVMVTVAEIGMAAATTKAAVAAGLIGRAVSSDVNEAVRRLAVPKQFDEDGGVIRWVRQRV